MASLHAVGICTADSAAVQLTVNPATALCRIRRIDEQRDRGRTVGIEARAKTIRPAMIVEIANVMRAVCKQSGIVGMIAFGLQSCDREKRRASTAELSDGLRRTGKRVARAREQRTDLQG